MSVEKVVVVGSYVQDLAFQTAVFPAPGETRIGRFVTGPGGKGFNQAIAAHRQSIKTIFFFFIGDDLFGREVQRFAREEGLECCFEICKAETTGAAAILVNDAAENQIVVSLGANEKLSVEHVGNCLEQIGPIGV